MKRIFCLLLIVISLNFVFVPYTVNAATQKSENNYIICQYSNNESSSDKIKFELFSINKTYFDGHLQVKESSGIVDFDNDVSGTIKYIGDYFQC